MGVLMPSDSPPVGALAPPGDTAPLDFDHPAFLPHQRSLYGFEAAFEDVVKSRNLQGATSAQGQTNGTTVLALACLNEMAQPNAPPPPSHRPLCFALKTYQGLSQGLSIKGTGSDTALHFENRVSAIAWQWKEGNATLGSTLSSQGSNGQGWSALYGYLDGIFPSIPPLETAYSRKTATLEARLPLAERQERENECGLRLQHYRAELDLNANDGATKFVLPFRAGVWSKQIWWTSQSSQGRATTVSFLTLGGEGTTRSMLGAPGALRFLAPASTGYSATDLEAAIRWPAGKKATWTATVGTGRVRLAARTGFFDPAALGLPTLGLGDRASAGASAGLNRSRAALCHTRPLGGKGTLSTTYHYLWGEADARLYYTHALLYGLLPASDVLTYQAPHLAAHVLSLRWAHATQDQRWSLEIGQTIAARGRIYSEGQPSPGPGGAGSRLVRGGTYLRLSAQSAL